MKSRFCGTMSDPSNQDTSFPYQEASVIFPSKSSKVLLQPLTRGQPVSFEDKDMYPLLLAPVIGSCARVRPCVWLSEVVLDPQGYNLLHLPKGRGSQGATGTRGREPESRPSYSGATLVLKRAPKWSFPWSQRLLVSIFTATFPSTS